MLDDSLATSGLSPVFDDDAWAERRRLEIISAGRLPEPAAADSIGARWIPSWVTRVAHFGVNQTGEIIFEFVRYVNRSREPQSAGPLLR